MDTVEKRGTERVATSAEGHETAKIEELEEVGTPNDGSIDPANELKGPRLVLLHTGLCLCTLLTGLDFNLIATAIPVITSDFHSIGDVGWYGGAFYITLCVSQPLAGKTFVLFPKKVVYLAYLAIFEIGSLVCALSPSSRALIAGRAIAGAGASGIFAGGLVILTTVIPLHRRAIWTGTMNSTFIIASIIGPIIGGALTQHVTWRWCFYLNLPTGGFAAVVVLFTFYTKSAATENASLNKKLKSLDGVGFVLFAAAVTMLLLAIQLGGTSDRYAWNSSTIIGLFVGFAVVMPIFVAWQLHMNEYALIPVEIFARRNVILIYCSAFFSNGPFQCIIYWLPIWFQAILGLSPTSSGLRYLPTVISDVLTSLIGSIIVSFLGTWNPFLIAGTAFISVGGGLLTTLTPTISAGHWIGYQIFGGIGYSLIINMAHLGVQATLPPRLVPVGATTLLFVISASCTIFLAIGQAIFQQQLTSELSTVVSSSTVDRIISVGATSIRSVVDQDDLSAVVSAYSNAVTEVFYLPAAGPVLSFFFVCGTTWISTKRKDANARDGEEPGS